MINCSRYSLKYAIRCRPTSCRFYSAFRLKQVKTPRALCYQMSQRNFMDAVKNWLKPAVEVKDVELTAADFSVPPIPEVPVEDVIPVVLNAAGEPALRALGLGSYWTPTGWVQLLLEFLHADLGFSWCAAIFLCGLFFRLAMFPVTIITQRNAKKMQKYTPLLQDLQQKFTAARLRGDQMEVLKLSGEMMDFMKVHNIKPVRNLLYSLIQAPVFLSIFFGIRSLANFPIESMTTGGLWWFTNLTESDPYVILPILTAVTFAATLELGMDAGVQAGSVSPAAKIVMRGLPWFTLLFTYKISSAVVLYWFISNMISLTQSAVLKIPRVRKCFKIPDVKGSAVSKKSKKGIFKELKDSWKNSRLISEVEDRQRVNENIFRKAGISSVVPTFKEDPTKKKMKELQ